jgi:hypothetical protein
MSEAPERLFVQLTPMGGTISYISKPPDNRRPVYEYVRADLPRATADTEKAAQLADDFARRLRSINNHATAAGVEVLAKEIRELTPRATGETGLTVEGCLTELREMFPSRWVEVISGINAVGNEYYFARVYGLSRKPSCTSLDQAMAQVRAANEVEGKVNDG